MEGAYELQSKPGAWHALPLKVLSSYARFHLSLLASEHKHQLNYYDKLSPTQPLMSYLAHILGSTFSASVWNLLFDIHQRVPLECRSVRSVFVSHSYLDFGLHFLFDLFAHLLMLSMSLQDQNILPIQLSPSYSSRRNHPKDYASTSNEALFFPKHFPINNSYSICTSQAPQKTFMHLMSHTTSNPMSHTTEKIPHITFRASFPL